jgi:hypothetical protein
VPRLTVPRLPPIVDAIEAHAHVVIPDAAWQAVPDGAHLTPAAKVASGVWVGGGGHLLTQLVVNGPGHSVDVKIDRYESKVTPAAQLQKQFQSLSEWAAGLTDATTEWAVYLTLAYPATLRSLIQLPTRVASGSMSEIRGFRFARTQDPKYELIIERPEGDEGPYGHHAIFSMAGPLSRATITGWVDKAIEISNGFIERDGVGTGS